jgi:hypothetical protein
MLLKPPLILPLPPISLFMAQPARSLTAGSCIPPPLPALLVQLLRRRSEMR